MFNRFTLLLCDFENYIYKNTTTKIQWQLVTMDVHHGAESLPKHNFMHVHKAQWHKAFDLSTRSSTGHPGRSEKSSVDAAGSARTPALALSFSCRIMTHVKIIFQIFSWRDAHEAHVWAKLSIKGEHFIYMSLTLAVYCRIFVAFAIAAWQCKVIFTPTKSIF